MREKEPKLPVMVVEFTHHDYAIGSLREAEEVVHDIEEMAYDFPLVLVIYRTYRPPSPEVLDCN